LLRCRTVEQVLNREAAAIRIGLAQLKFPDHTTYTELGPDPCLYTLTLTWILHYGSRSSASREHITHFVVSFIPDGFTGVCYTILSPSLHSQCAVIVPHKGISQMLGLLEYVASTTNHDHKQVVQQTVLNRHGRGHYVQPQTGRKPRFCPV
jgi:hypothetical protein